MPRHILYAYVDGCDLKDVADALDSKLVAFVAGRRWIAGRARPVNRRHAPEQSSHPGDLPDWDLGLNLELPDPGTEPAAWFTDVEAIAGFLGQLHVELDRSFIIGIADTETGIAEDLFSISSAYPDLGRLRAIVGVGGVE